MQPKTVKNRYQARELPKPRRVPMTRVLLAEDNSQMACMVESLLECSFEIVGTVDNGQALLDAEQRLGPDVCVIDIGMPVMDGIEAAKCLSARGATTRIVFLTMENDQELARHALGRDWSYVLKASMVSDLVEAIGAALAGRVFVSPAIDLAEPPA